MNVTSVTDAAVLSHFFILLFTKMCFLDVPVASWFISPLLSGLMSGLLFLLIRYFILSKVGKAFLASAHVSLNLIFSNVTLYFLV